MQTELMTVLLYIYIIPYALSPDLHTYITVKTAQVSVKALFSYVLYTAIKTRHYRHCMNYESQGSCYICNLHCLLRGGCMVINDQLV